MNIDEYRLLDSGEGKKLEAFGPFTLVRPCSQAIWHKQQDSALWRNASGTFSREGENSWTFANKISPSWQIRTAEITFKIVPTDFGHLGIFPEQKPFWLWIKKTVQKAKKQYDRPLKVLNLFAYSGGATFAAAQGGAHVCHLDASKGMVEWARENAELNGLQNAPIRWIVDDVQKFLKRELRRGSKYDAIILDPPTFGRGNQGELFKIESDLPLILQLCRSLLSDNPLFILLSCHTPGFTPLMLSHLLDDMTKGLQGVIDYGEMTLTGDENIYPLPSGGFARWQNA